MLRFEHVNKKEIEKKILEYIKKNPELTKTDLQKLTYDQNANLFDKGTKFKIFISNVIEDMISRNLLNFSAKTKNKKELKHEFDLIKLEGSEKQVEWANKIRDKFIKAYYNPKTHNDKKEIIGKIINTVKLATEYIEMRTMI